MEDPDSPALQDECAERLLNYAAERRAAMPAKDNDLTDADASGEPEDD